MNFPVSKTLFIWLAVVFATAIAFFYFYQPAGSIGTSDWKAYPSTGSTSSPQAGLG